MTTQSEQPLDQLGRERTGHRPLSGVKVLSFEIQVAGPYCTMMLADHGAEVTKVERPGEGDSSRGGAPMVANDEGDQQSGYFLRFNRNKRSITLDLKTDDGQEVFRRLAADTDVLVENFRPGLLDKLGLGYDSLRESNPGLIYASITGFGSLRGGDEGPYNRRPAYDIVAQAMGGLMNTCGAAGGPPTWLGVALGDIVSGMNAAQAITLALYDRAQTGQGRFIDISMYDTMVALAERSVTAYSLTGRVLERGNEPYMAPWGPFQTADGWVALIVATERDWKRFCAAIERPDLIDADGTRSGPERAAGMSGPLGDAIRAWFAEHATDAVVERLLDAGLAVGPVQDASEVFECAQVASRELLIDVPDPVLGSVRLVGSPLKFSDDPGPRTEPAPRLGEHTDEILTGAGYGAGDVARLRTLGVV
jgi:CoA:oxalate CoA-transferase